MDGWFWGFRWSGWFWVKRIGELDGLGWKDLFFGWKRNYCVERFWVFYLGVILGCSTWVFHLGVSLGCSTWVFHLGVSLGCFTWVFHLGVSLGCFTWVFSITFYSCLCGAYRVDCASRIGVGWWVEG